MRQCFVMSFFFFNHTATTEIYTLSLHDALPIFRNEPDVEQAMEGVDIVVHTAAALPLYTPKDIYTTDVRSEEHTSELQSQSNLVCRLLLEKKKNYNCFHEHVLWMLIRATFFLFF